MSTHSNRPSATKRRAVTAALAATLILGGAGTAAATYSPSSDASSTSSSGASDSSSQPSVRGALEPIELAPYEPLDINEDYQLGMLPEGKQNYVVSSPERFEESIETAKGYPGTNIRPNSFSLGTSAESGDVYLVDGAWRHEEIPSQIILSRPGEDFGWAAQIVHLPGETEWGTFYLSTTHLDDLDEFTVTAYDQDNEVFYEKDYESWASGS